MEEFTKYLQALIFTQIPTLNVCWTFHPQMVSKLSQTVVTYFLYPGSMMCRYKSFHSRKVATRDEAYSFVSESEKCSIVWKHSLKGLAQTVLTLKIIIVWEWFL